MWRLNRSLSTLNGRSDREWVVHLPTYCICLGIVGITIRVFTSGLKDRSSIPGRVIPKTQKIVLDTFLLNTQHYKVRIKGKVDQSREKSNALACTSV